MRNSVNCISAFRAASRAMGVAAILATTACSDDPAVQSSSAGIDLADVRACELLTADEIEAATGVAVAAGQDVSQAGGRLPMCNWARAGSDTDVVVSLLVTHSSYDDFDEFVASARDSAFGDTLGDAQVERVTGVGRFGVWLPETTMLQAYGDAAMVQTQVNVAAGGDALEAAKVLAAAALEDVR